MFLMMCSLWLCSSNRHPGPHPCLFSSLILSFLWICWLCLLLGLLVVRSYLMTWNAIKLQWKKLSQTSLSHNSTAQEVVKLKLAEKIVPTMGTKNTSTSHLCAVLVFFVPMVGLSLIHRFGKHAPLAVHLFMANVYLFVPPMLNPIIYSIKTKEIRHAISKFLGLRKANVESWA